MASKHPHHHHHHVMKNFINFLILVVAFSILLVFATNSANIIEGENFKTFMVLAVAGCGLLIGLLYLVNNSTLGSAPKAKIKKRK